MQAYFDERYSADNTVLALAGRIDFDAVVEQASRLCGAWRRTGATRTYPDRARADGAFTETDDTVNRHYLLMLAPAPGAG